MFTSSSTTPLSTTPDASAINTYIESKDIDAIYKNLKIGKKFPGSSDLNKILEIAIEKNHPQTILLIIEECIKGEDIYTIDSFLNSGGKIEGYWQKTRALKLAVQKDCRTVIDSLIAQDTYFNLPDLWMNYKPPVELLMKFTQQVDEDQLKEVYSLAIGNNLPEIATLCIDRGLDPNTLVSKEDIIEQKIIPYFPYKKEQCVSAENFITPLAALLVKIKLLDQINEEGQKNWGKLYLVLKSKGGEYSDSLPVNEEGNLYFWAQVKGFNSLVKFAEELGEDKVLSTAQYATLSLKHNEHTHFKTLVPDLLSFILKGNVGTTYDLAELLSSTHQETKKNFLFNWANQLHTKISPEIIQHLVNFKEGIFFFKEERAMFYDALERKLGKKNAEEVFGKCHPKLMRFSELCSMLQTDTNQPNITQQIQDIQYGYKDINIICSNKNFLPPFYFGAGFDVKKLEMYVKEGLPPLTLIQPGVNFLSYLCTSGASLPKLLLKDYLEQCTVNDLSRKCTPEMMPFETAIMNKNFLVAKKLIQQGAPFEQDHKGLTPIAHIAGLLNTLTSITNDEELEIIDLYRIVKEKTTDQLNFRNCCYPMALKLKAYKLYEVTKEYGEGLSTHLFVSDLKKIILLNDDNVFLTTLKDYFKKKNIQKESLSEYLSLTLEESFLTHIERANLFKMLSEKKKNELIKFWNSHEIPSYLSAMIPHIKCNQKSYNVPVSILGCTTYQQILWYISTSNEVINEANKKFGVTNDTGRKVGWLAEYHKAYNRWYPNMLNIESKRSSQILFSALNLNPSLDWDLSLIIVKKCPSKFSLSSIAATLGHFFGTEKSITIPFTDFNASPFRKLSQHSFNLNNYYINFPSHRFRNFQTTPHLRQVYDETNTSQQKENYTRQLHTLTLGFLIDGMGYSENEITERKFLKGLKDKKKQIIQYFLENANIIKENLQFFVDIKWFSEKFVNKWYETFYANPHALIEMILTDINWEIKSTVKTVSPRWSDNKKHLKTIYPEVDEEELEWTKNYIDNEASSLKSMHAVELSDKTFSRDQAITYLNLIMNSPKRSEILDKLYTLNYFEIEMGGDSSTKYWAHTFKDLFEVNIQEFSDSSKKIFLEKMRERLNLIIQQPIQTIKKNNLLNQLVDEGWTFQKWQGRTCIFTNKQGRCRAIKWQKKGERQEELSIECEVVKLLNENKNFLKLKCSYPEPIGVYEITGLMPYPLRNAPESELTANEKNGKQIVYIYDCPNDHYFTYLHDPSITDEERKLSRKSILSDLTTLAEIGYYLTSICDAYHTFPDRAAKRMDNAEYHPLADLLGIGSVQRGSGRLHNWTGAIEYVDERKGEHLADVGDGSLFPATDLPEGYLKERNLSYSPCDYYKKAYEPKIMSDLLASYHLVDELVIGRSTFQKHHIDWTNDGALKKIEDQLIDGASWMLMNYAGMTEEDSRKLAVDCGIDWKRYARQMAFWMQKEEYMPHLKKNNRSLPEGIYPESAIITLENIYSFSNWSDSDGLQTVDGPCIGVFNGGYTIKEGEKARYITVLSMLAKREGRLLAESDELTAKNAIENKEYDKAREYLERSILITPSARKYHLLAKVHEQLGNYILRDSCLKQYCAFTMQNAHRRRKKL
ncbi:MAG: hypothetical protein VX777_01935 [Chlamydiota bacterium]|nr:hypothetical protein [Chlamydiota bacterium]